MPLALAMGKAGIRLYRGYFRPICRFWAESATAPGATYDFRAASLVIVPPTLGGRFVSILILMSTIK
jgi:hypothetical protein